MEARCRLAAAGPGSLRMHGFVSRPQLQKLNRNSMYIFVNQRLIRDRLILHALTEAYRNVIPPTSFPVVLLFLEMPPQEVDVNVHPAKTEVRFRQQAFVHDFVRDAVRNSIIKARPAASFLTALSDHAVMTPALVPDLSPLPGAPEPADSSSGELGSIQTQVSEARTAALAVANSFSGGDCISGFGPTCQCRRCGAV